MPKRTDLEDSGSTESLENISSQSESDKSFSDEEEDDRVFMKRGRPKKNSANMHQQMHFAGPAHNFPNQPQVQYPHNMLYRNMNMQRQPHYMYNQGMPGNFRYMGYPSNLGPSNPSFIGNIAQQYGFHSVQNYNRQFPSLHPQNYQYPPQFQHFKPQQQSYPYSQFYVPPPPPPPPQQRYTPPLPPRVDREKKREEKLKKRKKESPKINEHHFHQEFIESEEIEEIEEDKHEKLLDFRNNYFFVKFRGVSYVHCEWVGKQDVIRTRAGAIKAKRFLSRFKLIEYPMSTESGRSIQQIIKEDFNNSPPFDPEYLKIDRVISVDTMVLIKWKNLAYELSTFEKLEDVKELDGFNEELEKFKKRNIIKKSKYPIDYRPPKDSLIIEGNFKNGNSLRDYQLEGLNWLLNRWYYKQGSIMADEMGLGKTVQTVCFVNKIYETGYQHPILIVAPLSTLIHWEREFQNWTELRVLLYHGNNVARDLIYDYEFYNNGLLFDVLITTYEMVMSGIKHLNFNFGVGVFDEAHRLKNNNSKAFQTLMTLSFNHKILLSGTPLQNNLTELWALLHFLDPLKNESLSYFLESYKLEKSEDVDRLKTLLKPIMLRRMKDDVEKIPIKEETIVEVELTMIQKQFYRAILEKNLSIFEKDSPNLLNVMMELRKCCIHPYLVRGAEEKIIHDYKLKRKIDAIKQRRLNEDKEFSEKEEIEKIANDEANKEIGEEKIESANDENVVEENKKIEAEEKQLEAVKDGRSEVIDASKTELIEDSKTELEEEIKTEVIGENQNDNVENVSNLNVESENENGKKTLNEAVGNDNKMNSSIDSLTEEEKDTSSDINALSENVDEQFDQKLKNETQNEGIAQPITESPVEWTKRLHTEELSVDEYYRILIQSSGKLVLLDKLLEKLKGKHKVLIFSQMTKCLDLLSDYLHYKRYKFERIDGAVRGDCRQAAIDRFSAEASESFVFLLCTRAGGMGINLTSADTCVIFDSDWNPQNDLQAQARCHRIGQTKSVKIYRLITRNTYEREMFDKAGLKLGLDQAILQKNTKGVKKKEYIESLLKKGAWGVLMENDDAAQKFCEEDIDIMLQRRTQIIRHDQEAGQNVFSRASFQVEEEFDDPDFWQNLISKRKNAENEIKIKRIIRRLGRELPTDYIEIDRILETTNNEMVKVFLLIFKKGIGCIIDDVEDVKEKISKLIRFCYSTIQEKNKEDFKLHLETYFKEEDFIKIEHPIVAKLAEKFLLRLQAVNILKYLYKLETLEYMKGGSIEEDRRIVNWVISNGYDNWPTGIGKEKSLFRGKDRADLNSRVRKIILSLNKMTENQKDREHEHEIENLIMNYGRVTGFNESDLTENIEEMNKKVELATTQKRKRNLYGHLNKRINLIDSLAFLELTEIKRTVGLPRTWKKEDDENMIKMVQSRGIANTATELGLSDEIIVRRLETLVSYQDENE